MTVIVSPTITATIAALPWISVTSFNAKGDGVTNDSTAFINADTSNAGNNITKVPPTSNSYLIGTNTTINHALDLPAGAKFSISTGITLYLKGDLRVGPYQIFTGPGTVVLGSSVGAAIFPQWWGAKGDGVTDDTAAIQAALTAAGPFNGTVVLLPTANGYLCSGLLSIPDHVSLVGEYKAPPRAGFTVSQGGGVPTTSLGSALLTTAGAGTTTVANAFITLHNDSVLEGVMIHYPNQTNTSPPITYPPAVLGAANCENASVRNCLLVNPYVGLYFDLHGRFFLDNVQGQPLYAGLIVDRCYDTPRIDNIHFWPFWKAVGQAVTGWAQANGTAMAFYRVDGVMGNNWLIYGYLIDILMENSPTGAGGGSGLVSNVWLDGSQYNFYYLDGSRQYWKFTNVVALATIGGASARCVFGGVPTGSGITGQGSGLWITNGDLESTAAPNATNIVDIANGQTGRFNFTRCNLVGYTAAPFKWADPNAVLEAIGCDMFSAASAQLPAINTTTLTNSTTAKREFRGCEVFYGTGSGGWQTGTGSPIAPVNFSDNRGARGCGSATIAVSATSVVVNHGLVSAPGHVRLTPVNDPQQRYWWDTPTATTFTIHLAAAASGTVAAFDWEAQCSDG